MNLFLSAIADGFDEARIRWYLEGRPGVVLDPLGTGAYMMIGVDAAAARKAYGQARLAHPSRFPYVITVRVSTDQVVVAQEYGDQHALRSARQFVDWLCGQQPCRIEDEYGNDLTERVARNGVQVLYPALDAQPDDGAWTPNWYDPLPALGPRMVVEYTGDAVHTVDPASVAWRVEWPDGDWAGQFAGLLERLLDSIGADRLTALVIGVSEPWADDVVGAASLNELVAAVSLLVEAAPRLVSLTGLALFDITTFKPEDAELAAWRTPVDVTALLRAFPRLEILHVCGALQLAPVRHDRLRRLWVHSADPGLSAAQALAECEFAAMESQHVRLG